MSPNHQYYAESLADRLLRWLQRQARRLPETWLHAALVLLRLDLEPARPPLEALSSPNPRGRKPFDPICMLRAFLLLWLLGDDSIPKFADTLQHTPRLASLAGFDPDTVPSGGVFSLFLDRLEDSPYQKPCPHRVRPSTLRTGKHRRNLSHEKVQRQRELAEYDSVTQKRKDDLLAAQDQPRPKDLQHRLEDILLSCGVIPSAQRGLRGDVSHLIVCGDGSALVSGANPQGKPPCTCRQEGLARCAHDRLSTDPTADWGDDSSRNCSDFGHTDSQHVVSTNGHDVPGHVTLGPASETDFTLSLNSLDRLRKALTDHKLDWQIDTAVYTAGHDARGNYEYLMETDITPAIALNPRAGTHPKPTGTAERVTAEGIPLCDAGLPMRRHSYNPHKPCLLFHCPVKRPTQRPEARCWLAHAEGCPLGRLCQPDTKMGPIVSVKTSDNPRLSPPIARDSVRCEPLMDVRTGCERSNAVQKETYRLGYRPSRNASHFLMRLAFASLLEQAKAWLAEARKRVGEKPLALIRSALAGCTAHEVVTHEVA